MNREIIEEIIFLEDDEIIQKKLEEYENFYKQEKSISKYHEFYIITKMERGNDFIEDVQSDIRLFEKLLQKFDDLNLQLRDSISLSKFLVNRCYVLMETLQAQFSRLCV